jgi:hypothetical protein
MTREHFKRTIYESEIETISMNHTLFHFLITATILGCVQEMPSSLSKPVSDLDPPDVKDGQRR